MPEVGKIFLLIKAKNKEAAMERLMNEVCQLIVFLGLVVFIPACIRMLRFKIVEYLCIWSATDYKYSTLQVSTREAWNVL